MSDDIRSRSISKADIDAILAASKPGRWRVGFAVVCGVLIGLGIANALFLLNAGHSALVEEVSEMVLDPRSGEGVAVESVKFVEPTPVAESSRKVPTPADMEAVLVDKAIGCLKAAEGAVQYRDSNSAGFSADITEAIVAARDSLSRKVGANRARVAVSRLEGAVNKYRNGNVISAEVEAAVAASLAAVTALEAAEVRVAAVSHTETPTVSAADRVLKALDLATGGGQFEVAGGVFQESLPIVDALVRMKNAVHTCDNGRLAAEVAAFRDLFKMQVRGLPNVVGLAPSVDLAVTLATVEAGNWSPSEDGRRNPTADEQVVFAHLDGAKRGPHVIRWGGEIVKEDIAVYLRYLAVDLSVEDEASRRELVRRDLGHLSDLVRLTRDNIKGETTVGPDLDIVIHRAENALRSWEKGKDGVKPEAE